MNHAGTIIKEKYLNVYIHDRRCGGPEEGGWWYDYNGPVSSEPVAAKEAEKLLEEKRKELEKENEGKPDVCSVISEGILIALIEDEPGKETERPGYE